MPPPYSLLSSVFRCFGFESRVRIVVRGHVELFTVDDRTVHPIGVSVFLETACEFLKQLVIRSVMQPCDGLSVSHLVGPYISELNQSLYGTVTLTVADNGIGIPKEAQSSVFERFYRVDKSRSKATGGTGLGLAIVKHIARIHNARIKLESQVDVGTTITVTFPTAN